MKKFFSFILAFIFVVPLTFTLAGCKDTNLKNNINNINDLCSSLKDENFLETYSFDEDFDFTLNTFDIINNQNSNTQTQNKSIKDIKFGAHKDFYSLFVPDSLNALFYENQDIIVKNGKAESHYLSNNSQEPCVYNNISKLHKGTLYNIILSMATKIKDCNVSFKIDENENFNVTANYNLKNAFNDFLSAFLNNKDKNFKTLINNLFYSVTNKDFDIISCITEFENSYTDKTTLSDLINFISTKTGFNFEEIFKFLINVYNLKSVNEKIYADHLTFDNYPNYELENNMFNNFGFIKIADEFKHSILTNSLINYDNIKTTVLSSLLTFEGKPEGKTDKEYLFETIKTTLCSDEISLDILNSNNGILNDSYANLISAINGVNFNKFILKVNLVLDKNLKTKNANLSVDFEMNKFTDEVSKTGSGFNIFAQAIIKVDDTFNPILQPITYTSYEFLITIVLEKNKVNFNNPKFGVLLTDLKLPIKSFNISGDCYPDLDNHIHTTFLQYNKDTKNFIFDSAAVKYAIDNNYDVVEFSTNSSTQEKTTVRLIFE